MFLINGKAKIIHMRIRVRIHVASDSQLATCSITNTGFMSPNVCSFPCLQCPGGCQILLSFRSLSTMAGVRSIDNVCL